MGLINIRELLQFPAGDNSTDTVINGIHFNQTALEFYNYTLYSNNTISNDSKCYLIFDEFKPIMWSNGSWISETKCDVPYYGVNIRGKLSIAFVAAYGLMVFMTLMNLRKHGKRYLKEDKRFRIIGRRWQWYWMLFVAACGMISCVTGIDVDRNYVQHLPIILQSFFFALMLPGALAMVWEGIRHWGSWQERQICDRDLYLLPQDDRRSRTELYLPLLFYLFTWMNFFMVIPRKWTTLRYQNSPEQMTLVAEPSATDIRWKIAGFFAIISWGIILYSLHHSVKHYKEKSSTLLDKVRILLKHTPTKFFLFLLILGIRIIYSIASAWDWNVSILKHNVSPAWPFALGYGSVLVLLLVMNIYGYRERNEDRILITQRVERGREQDAALGVIKKPGWWSRMHSEHKLTAEERRRALAEEGSDQRQASSLLELQPMGGAVRNRSRSRPRSDDRNEDTSGAYSLSAERSEDDSDSIRTGLTGRTLTADSQGQAQRVRSMLDV